MNIAVIFAGGLGRRMNNKDKPKQFLEVKGKPIIIYTLEIFEKHKEIDKIVVVCVKEWISYLENLLEKFHIKKVESIVAGGKTGQISIFNGLVEAERISKNNNSIVVIHDGVRPLINNKVISDNIKSVKLNGSAITSSITKETTVVINGNNEVVLVPSRENSKIARAPQSFYLKDILDVHKKAIKDGIFDAIDSCSLMKRYGKKLFIIDGPCENIKVTTSDDFYLLNVLLKVKEDS